MRKLQQGPLYLAAFSRARAEQHLQKGKVPDVVLAGNKMQLNAKEPAFLKAGPAPATQLLRAKEWLLSNAGWQQFMLATSKGRSGKAPFRHHEATLAGEQRFAQKVLRDKNKACLVFRSPHAPATLRGVFGLRGLQGRSLFAKLPGSRTTSTGRIFHLASLPVSSTTACADVSAGQSTLLTAVWLKFKQLRPKLNHLMASCVSRSAGPLRLSCSHRDSIGYQP